jgi:hypothetical protein
MLDVGDIRGVIAGVICWFIPEEKTLFIPIQVIERYRLGGAKSINLRNDWDVDFIEIHGKKKRVFYEYDFAGFINQCNTRMLGEKDFS